MKNNKQVGTYNLAMEDPDKGGVTGAQQDSILTIRSTHKHDKGKYDWHVGKQNNADYRRGEGAGIYLKIQFKSLQVSCTVFWKRQGRVQEPL